MRMGGWTSEDAVPIGDILEIDSGFNSLIETNMKNNIFNPEYIVFLQVLSSTTCGTNGSKQGLGRCLLGKFGHRWLLRPRQRSFGKPNKRCLACFFLNFGPRRHVFCVSPKVLLEFSGPRYECCQAVKTKFDDRDSGEFISPVIKERICRLKRFKASFQESDSRKWVDLTVARETFFSFQLQASQPWRSVTCAQKAWFRMPIAAAACSVPWASSQRTWAVAGNALQVACGLGQATASNHRIITEDRRLGGEFALER